MTGEKKEVTEAAVLADKYTLHKNINKQLSESWSNQYFFLSWHYAAVMWWGKVTHDSVILTNSKDPIWNESVMADISLTLGGWLLPSKLSAYHPQLDKPGRQSQLYPSPPCRFPLWTRTTCTPDPLLWAWRTSATDTITDICWDIGLKCTSIKTTDHSHRE